MAASTEKRTVAEETLLNISTGFKLRRMANDTNVKNKKKISSVAGGEASPALINEKNKRLKSKFLAPSLKSFKIT